MSLENYFKALRLKKEALDIRDEVIQLLTDNEEREQRFDDQLKSLLGRYNREVGVLKQKVKAIETLIDEAEEVTETVLVAETDGRDLSDEEREKLRVLASKHFERPDLED